MGRIHRYGQKKDKVIIVNLVSSGTREGKVLHVLLQKMEAIRKQLHSEKVFDVIGRVFEGVSIGRYMEMELLGTGAGAAELEGRLTPEQVEAIVQRERALYGEGGDVRKLLPSLRAELTARPTGTSCRAMSGTISKSPRRCSVCGSKAASKDVFRSLPQRPARSIRFCRRSKRHPPTARARSICVRRETAPRRSGFIPARPSLSCGTRSC